MCLRMFSVVMVVSFIMSSCTVGGRDISVEEEIVLERQLQILNKPPLKSFQDGIHIIDCVDIYKQPAFDHPLLRNHKIQMRPTTTFNKMSNNDNLSTNKHRMSILNGVDCPKGTVPIRRTWKEDLIRAKSYTKKHASHLHPQIEAQWDEHISWVSTKCSNEQKFRGGRAFLDVCGNITVLDQQASSAQVVVQTIQFPTTLQAGWMVSKVGDDNQTRFFIMWRTNTHGCYNTLCPGFVQVDWRYHVGADLNLTLMDKSKQHEIDITLFQDMIVGNWWVRLLDVYIGYWPKLIIPALAKGADYVTWEGSAQSNTKDFPKMGNGNFPKDGNAAYIRCMQTAIPNSLGFSINFQDPDESVLETGTSKPECYDVQDSEERPGRVMRYGGPGGVCGNVVKG